MFPLALNKLADDASKLAVGGAASASAVRQRPPAELFVFVLGMGLWLLSHPYWGIWHDARVYTLMAVRWLDPASFSRDPWFMFGSQDAFTLFSPIYGAAISVFGVDAAAKWGALLAGTCYVAACWWFSRVLPLGRQRSLLFLLLVSVQLVYCINDFGLTETFRVSEPFITSRQFSIAFAMAGIAAVVGGNRTWAAMMFLASIVLHPLMGVWAMLVVLGARVPLRVRSLLILVALGSLLLACLSVIGVGAFRPVKGEWGEMVRGSALIVFVAPDGRHRLEIALICYAVLLCAARWGRSEMKRWYAVALIVSFAAYAVNWFCSEFFPAAIVMQAQLWRANWLALIFAVVAVVDVAARVYTMGRLARELAAAGAGVALLFPVAGGGLAIAAVCCRGTVTIMLQEAWRRMGNKARLAVRAGCAVVVALAGFSVVTEIYAAGAALWRTGDATDSLSDFARGLLFTGGYGLLAFASWWVGAFSRRRVLIAVASALLLAIGLYRWDDRRSPVRELEEQSWGRSMGNAARTFAVHVRPGDTVYWQGRPERVWYELRTASYVSSTQAIGIVFSERMALEVARRLSRVTLAGAPAPVPSNAAEQRSLAVELRNADDTQVSIELSDLHTYEAAKLTVDGLRFLCRDPELDFVIHEEQFPGHVLASATEVAGKRQVLWNLYDCEPFRQSQSRGGA